MTISQNSWHFRLYLYYMNSLNKEDVYPSQVNLCPYMRTLLLWLPLQFLFKRVLLGVIWVFIVVGLFKAYGWKAIAVWCGWGLLGIATLVAIVAAGTWLAMQIRYADYDRAPLLVQWLKAKHDKICPVIKVK